MQKIAIKIQFIRVSWSFIRKYDCYFIYTKIFPLVTRGNEIGWKRVQQLIICVIRCKAYLTRKKREKKRGDISLAMESSKKLTIIKLWRKRRDELCPGSRLTRRDRIFTTKSGREFNSRSEKIRWREFLNLMIKRKWRWFLHLRLNIEKHNFQELTIYEWNTRWFACALHELCGVIITIYMGL